MDVPAQKKKKKEKRTKLPKHPLFSINYNSPNVKRQQTTTDEAEDKEVFCITSLNPIWPPLLLALVQLIWTQTSFSLTVTTTTAATITITTTTTTCAHMHTCEKSKKMQGGDSFWGDAVVLRNNCKDGYPTRGDSDIARKWWQWCFFESWLTIR